jgi:hypothetical protein
MGTYKSDVSASIYRIPVSDFASGSVTPGKIYETTSYSFISRINLLPDEGKMAFYVQTIDNHDLIPVVMSMDGSGNPTYDLCHGYYF